MGWRPGPGGTGDYPVPGSGLPGDGKSGTGKSGTGQPGTGDSGTGKSGTGKPGTVQFGTAQSGTGQPETGQPGTDQHRTGKHGAAQPEQSPPFHGASQQSPPFQGAPQQGSPLQGFGRGGEWDTARPSAALAVALESAAGGEWRCPGATRDELLGMLRQWQALESWAAAGKLGLLRALIRDDDEPLPGGGYHGDLPDGWSRSLTHEVALALSMPAVSAEQQMWLAWDLQALVPGIGDLLAGGELTLAKARAVDKALGQLTDEDAAKAEAMIVPDLPGKTYGQAEKLAVQAAITVDPESAARRREDAERHKCRVQLFREDSGAAALSGRDMPTDQTLAAHANVCARAQQYHDSGVFDDDTRMDQFRVAAYLDLINGITAEARIGSGHLVSIGRPGENPGPGQQAPAGHDDPDGPSPDGDGPDGDGPDGDGPDGDGPDDEGPDDEGPDEDRRHEDDLHGDGPDEDSPHGDGPHGDGPHGNGPDEDSADRGGPHSDGQDGASPDEDSPRGDSPDGDSPGDDGPRRDGPDGDSPHGAGTGGSPPPRPADLVIPLATLLGLAERPGEGHGLGPLDPRLCRELARAAVASPHSRICVTVTGQDGIAIGHGCARRKGGTLPAALASLPARVNLTIAADQLTELAGPPDSSGSWAFTRTGDTGPPGGYGIWTLTLPGGRSLAVELEPVPTLDCDHRHESHAYQPSARLRHLVQVRDGTCTFPPCSRHARESDFEHALPYDKGGRTCACNAGARSRTCHQVKQSPGWIVTQPRPGWHQWQTPSGRVYRQSPKRYPA